jgi:divalent metal cation (Fe/Co/Zn/Cd) transporter
MPQPASRRTADAIIALAGVAPTRATALRRARRLEYFTLAWNSLEAVVSLAAGVLSGSIALIGFGMDSVIENGSAVALLWRLRRANEATERQRERAEAVALRVVGALFLLLAAYLAFDSILVLFRHLEPARSVVGIVMAAAAVVVMPLLGRAKRRTAKELASGALRADSRQSDFCAYLAGITLVGLALNALFGWWWADPVSALLITMIIAREGVSALRGQACGCAGPAIDPCCTAAKDGVRRVVGAEEKWRKGN